jgi:hypothetical protein
MRGLEGKARHMGAERRLLLGAAVTVGVLFAPLLLSSERYRNLVAAGILAAVLVELVLILGRILAGRRSAFPPTWTSAQRRMIRMCQGTMALITVAAWGIAVRAVYAAAPVFSHGMIAESLANSLFGAGAASLALLAIIGPRDYQDRDLVRIPLWIALVALIVVFVNSASVGRY